MKTRRYSGAPHCTAALLRVPRGELLKAKDFPRGELSLIGKHEPPISVVLRCEPVLASSSCPLVWRYRDRLSSAQLLRWDEIPALDLVTVIDGERKQVRSSDVLTWSSTVVATSSRAFSIAEPESRSTIAQHSRSDLHGDRVLPVRKFDPNVRGHSAGGIVWRVARRSAESLDFPAEGSFRRLAPVAIVEPQLRPIRSRWHRLEQLWVGLRLWFRFGLRLGQSCQYISGLKSVSSS